MAPSKDSKPLQFMNCIIKVKKRTFGWQKTVMKVLSEIRGVLNSTMDDKGNVTVSGKVDPHILVKRLGKSCKSAELSWLQYGESSSNLYPPSRFSSNNSSFNGSTTGNNGFIDYDRNDKYAGRLDNYYEGYGGGQVNYPDRRPFATPATQNMYGRRAAPFKCGNMYPSAPVMDWD